MVINMYTLIGFESFGVAREELEDKSEFVIVKNKPGHMDARQMMHKKWKMLQKTKTWSSRKCQHLPPTAVCV